MLKKPIRLKNVPKNKAFSIFFKKISDAVEDGPSKLVFLAYSQDSIAASEVAEESTKGRGCNWILENCTVAD